MTRAVVAVAVAAGVMSQGPKTTMDARGWWAETGTRRDGDVANMNMTTEMKTATEMKGKEMMSITAVPAEKRTAAGNPPGDRVRMPTSACRDIVSKLRSRSRQYNNTRHPDNCILRVIVV